MQRQNVNSRGIGMELSRHRRVADMTLDQVSKQLGMSMSTLSRLENGKREPTSEEVAGILAVLGVVGEERDQLLARARGIPWSPGLFLDGKSKEQGQTYQSFEAQATVITNFELLLVPGLAQTAEYAYAVVSAIQVNEDDRDIEPRIRRRMARKAILTRKRSPQLNLIMTELGLRQPIGGAKVMARQVRALIDLADYENVSIRVIPATVPVHAGLAGQFVILDFAAEPSVVFIEAGTIGLLRDDADDVASYRLQAEKLTDAAFSEPASVKLMRAIALELDER